MRFKAFINEYAKKNTLTAQVVLQNYMFERFLERLSLSPYHDNFIIKGGFLIASLVGLDTRSTMDLDTCVRNLSLSPSHLSKIIESIGSLNLSDGVAFKLISVESILRDDIYGGVRIRLDGNFDSIRTPLFIDISTGDILTPSAVLYPFNQVFESAKSIQIWGYSIETILAEKVQSILYRGIFNTRAKDYYDVYILVNTQPFDLGVFKEAFELTSRHRKTPLTAIQIEEILNQISLSQSLKTLWQRYRTTYAYAKTITYEATLEVLYQLLSLNPTSR
jgi:predicted nucleotidyltransferase component of viral defense system